MFVKNYKYNGFKMPLNMLNMKSINNFTQWKKWISRCDVRTRDHAPKASRAVLAQYAECSGHFQYTPRIY